MQTVAVASNNRDSFWSILPVWPLTSNSPAKLASISVDKNKKQRADRYVDKYTEREKEDRVARVAYSERTDQAKLIARLEEDLSQLEEDVYRQQMEAEDERQKRYTHELIREMSPSTPSYDFFYGP